MFNADALKTCSLHLDHLLTRFTLLCIPFGLLSSSCVFFFHFVFHFYAHSCHSLLFPFDNFQVNSPNACIDFCFPLARHTWAIFLAIAFAVAFLFCSLIRHPQTILVSVEWICLLLLFRSNIIVTRATTAESKNLLHVRKKKLKT